MGVPALFRWLSRKYPKIVLPVVEVQPEIMEGEDGEKTEIPVDMSMPNPNGSENDCLYLDMNGIVHPCTHPEGKPAPKTEGDMMMEVFKYTERVVNMARPRKILFMAIDGVAPRAKMNQQRSRRFRAADEAKLKAKEKEEAIKEWEAMGKVLSDEYKNAKAWDSNAITPGTPFMDLLASSLRYWVAYKMNTDPGWGNLQVIISDSSVPGEGEHKIVDFVRRQRSQPNYNHNTSHVFYGLDADLIMLSLATHEPNFKILREDVFAQGAKRGCHKCGQPGHHSSNCAGISEEQKQKQQQEQQVSPLKPFIFLDVSILREYLQIELNVPGVNFFDLERAIDDWVFMIFFVGNDFLPHLPSLDIREGAIDMLLKIWRDQLPLMGGYLTNNGTVELSRAQIIMDGLASKEDEIFRKRRETEQRQAEADKEKRQRIEGSRRGIGNTDRAPLPDRSEGTHNGLEYVPVLKETSQYQQQQQQAGQPSATPTANSSTAVSHANTQAHLPAPATSPAKSVPAPGPPKPKNPMFVSSRASGSAPIRNNFGLGGGRAVSSVASKSSAAEGNDVSSLVGDSKDVVINRAAIRKANLSAAEMLKAELAGKAKSAAAETAPAAVTDDAATTSDATAANASTDDLPAGPEEEAGAGASEIVPISNGSGSTQETAEGTVEDTEGAAAVATAIADGNMAVDGNTVSESAPLNTVTEPDGTQDVVLSTPAVVDGNIEEDVPDSAINGDGPALVASQDGADVSPSKSNKKRTADEADIPGTRSQAEREEAKEENGEEDSSSSSEDEEDDTDAGDTTTVSIAHVHKPPPLKMLGNNMVEQEDTVKLWEPNYRERYYLQKFNSRPEDADFRRQVAKHYVEGLCWVLAYYYKGCPSWTWYYPYHFAPFAADFTDLQSMDINFETGSPFRPFEQLMGVFPAASKVHLPVPFQTLMTEEDSEILDFYPEEFSVDMNGKKMLWQGVALLPFIDEKRLLGAMAKKYPELTEDEHRRNAFGKDVTFVNEDHPLYDQISSLYMKRKIDNPVPLDSQSSKGFHGTVLPDDNCVPNSTFINPLPEQPLSDLKNDKSISAYWWMPDQITPHTSSLLPGYQASRRVLTPEDIETIRRGGNGEGGGGRDRFRRGPAGDGFHSQRRDFENGRPRRDARDVARGHRGGGNFGGPPSGQRNGWSESPRHGGDRAGGGGGNDSYSSNYGGYGGGNNRGGDDRDRGRFYNDPYSDYGRNGYGDRQSSYQRGPPPPSGSSAGGSYGSYGGYGGQGGGNNNGYSAPPPPPPRADSYGGYGGGAPPAGPPSGGGSYGSYGSYGGYGSASAPVAQPLYQQQQYGSYGSYQQQQPPPPSQSPYQPPNSYGGGGAGYGYNPPPPQNSPQQGYNPSYGGGYSGAPPAQQPYQPPQYANRGAIVPPHLQQHQQGGQNQHARWNR